MRTLHENRVAPADKFRGPFRSRAGVRNEEEFRFGTVARASEAYVARAFTHANYCVDAEGGALLADRDVFEFRDRP